MNNPLDSTPGAGFNEKSQSLIFGKYEVIRRLALGGMGEVFLARQTGVALDRLVILKSLLPELAEEQDFIEQFLDEARVAATLNHPNIVSIYEVGLWNGVYFIAMEFIHGSDLSRLNREAKKKNIPIPFQVAARIVHDAASGLDHAHHAKSVNGEELEIVHRDISPQNIMVRGDGVTKVVDFGIAKASNRSSRTATGMLKGKLQYMAPEQVSGEELDGRADQFALGVVLWEMCTGKRLFKGENEIKTLENLLNAEIPTPSSITPGFPDELEEIIMKMLQRDKEKRYARLIDVSKAIKSYLESSSRIVGESQVSDYVQGMVGSQLKEVTKNLSPTQQNFLISLDNSGPNEFEATSLTQNVLKQKKNKMTGVIIGGLAALLLIAAVFFVIMADDEEDNVFNRNGKSTQTNPKSTQNDIKKAPPTVVPLKLSRKKVINKKDATQSNEIFALELKIPIGADVFVDDVKWAEKIPTIISPLKPGKHKITIIDINGKKQSQEITVKEIPPILTIISDPPGALIEASDKSWLRIAGEKIEKLAPGKHQIRISKNGYKSQTLAISLKAGQRLSKKVVLVRNVKTRIKNTERPPVTVTTTTQTKSSTGFLTLRTSPWTKVYIDGIPKGSTPLFKLKLKTGKHILRMVNAGEEIDTKKSITIRADKNLKKVWELN